LSIENGTGEDTCATGLFMVLIMLLLVSDCL